VADEERKVPEFKPDVPVSSVAIVKHDDARAMARRMAGEEAPNECNFHCITCGWGKTLQFEDDEIAALGGDITNYGGPCPECASMTLVPRASLMGDDVGTIYQKAKANRRAEYEEQAGVLVDRVKDEIAAVMGGSTLSPTPEEEHDPANVHDPRPPSQREELPDADSIDPSTIESRQE
jgi:hypothetical protein